MKIDNWLMTLRRLRAQGYDDARAGLPNGSGALPGRAERLEYCKGYEDWLEFMNGDYRRWTPAEDVDSLLGRRPD